MLFLKYICCGQNFPKDSLLIQTYVCILRLMLCGTIIVERSAPWSKIASFKFWYEFRLRGRIVLEPLVLVTYHGEAGGWISAAETSRVAVETVHINTSSYILVVGRPGFISLNFLVA